MYAFRKLFRWQILHDSQSRISLEIISLRCCICRHVNINDIIQHTKESSFYCKELKFGARCRNPAVAAFQQLARMKQTRSLTKYLYLHTLLEECWLWKTKIKNPSGSFTMPSSTAYHLLICYRRSYKGTVTGNISLSPVPGNWHDFLRVLKRQQ